MRRDGRERRGREEGEEKGREEMYDARVCLLLNH